jgi:hypothetical protein
VGALKRNIDPATLTALSRTPFYPVILVYLDWPDSPLYLHSNVGDISYDGKTWQGIGNFGGLQLPGEEVGLLSQPALARLIGVPQELDDFLEAPIRDREGEILFGVTTERAGNVLIGAPFSIFIGYMDALRDIVEAADGTLRRDIVLSLASGPSQRAFTDLFHTYEDQITAHPGDTGGRLFQNAEAEREKLTWPA